MIADFFNAPFQNYKEDRVQLQQLSEESPTLKNKTNYHANADFQKMRQKKLQSFSKQMQNLISTLVPSNYIEEILHLEKGECLKVKNTENSFFGETDIMEIQGSFFPTKVKVAQGLCQIFFQNQSYLIGFFQSGRLQSEFILILENGDYIKAKPKFNKTKRSVSGFITDDSESLASDDDSLDDEKINQSQIHLSVENREDFELFSDLQCQINFNGVYYQGNIKKGKLHGNIFQKTNDYEFSGNYYMGERKIGKLISKSGFSYEGTFKNNKFHGLGTLKTQQGIYNGEFKYGLKDGQGEFTWSDGSYYKGDYRKDKRNGTGFFKSKQGSFKGEWKDDQIEGAGYLVIGSHGIGGQWRKHQYEKPHKFF